MFLWEYNQEVSSLRGVGPAASARLERLGVRTVSDLLLLLPRGFEDRTSIIPLSAAASSEKVAVAATVSSLTEIGWSGRGRARTPKAVIDDGSAQASLVCFGRPFLRTILSPGRKFFIWGHFQVRAGELSCSDFELEPWSQDPASFGRVLPVYPLSEGLTHGALRKMIRGALDDVLPDLTPGLPDSLRRARGLPSLPQALASAHFPSSPREAELSRAALAYEELFFFEVGVLRRARALAVPRPHLRSRAPALRDRLIARLPFTLTKDQEAVTAEIDADL
ncbi:MAG TPA: hypothetical protein VMM82_08525, partial [Spirochaetia bacterium]|nr:hypothetical protein [Spirochaetia bacterium]